MRPKGRGAGRGCAFPVPPTRELAALYWSNENGGMPLNDMASKYGVSVATVNKWLEVRGIPRRDPGRQRKFSLTRDELRNLYEVKNMTLMEIAAQIGCQWETVRKYVKRFGIAARKPCPRKYKTCRVTGCTKPVKKIWHPIHQVWYGRMCAHHRRIHYAELNRWIQRRKLKRSPETWVYQNEVPDSFKKTKRYKKFEEEQCQKQARRQLSEVRSYLRNPAHLKSQSAAYQQGKTS